MNIVKTIAETVINDRKEIDEFKTFLSKHCKNFYSVEETRFHMGQGFYKTNYTVYIKPNPIIKEFFLAESENRKSMMIIAELRGDYSDEELSLNNMRLPNDDLLYFSEKPPTDGKSIEEIAKQCAESIDNALDDPKKFLIKSNPRVLELFHDPSRETQEFALSLDRMNVLKLKKVDEDLAKKYAYIKNLNRSGLFK